MKINKCIFVILLVFMVFGASACSVEKTEPSNAEILDSTMENTISKLEKLSATCDMILAAGDGYELVANQTDSFDKSIIEVGVIKNNEWLVPLSTKSPFVTEEGAWRIQDHPYIDDDGFKYIGEGCFVLYEKPKLLSDDSIKTDAVIYSAETNIGFYGCDFGIYHTFGGVYAGNSPMINFDYKNVLRGAKFVATDPSGRLKLYNLATGESKEIEGFLTGENFPREVGAYSEDLFYARGKNSVYQGFFNAEGQMVINLENYNASYITGNDAFENGEVTLRCENPNGIEFNVTIDPFGKVIKEERLED